MFKKWVAVQLTEISAWAGCFLMIAAFLHLPYFWIFLAGFALLASDDEWCKKKMTAWSPWIKAALE